MGTKQLIVSGVFLLLLLAPTARAHTPTSTATIPPTATVNQCPPPLHEPMSTGFVTWKPDKATYSVGEPLTFWAAIPAHPCAVFRGWVVNGIDIPFDSPDICHPTDQCLMITMPDNCELTVGASADLLPDSLCITPEPTYTPEPIPQPPEPTSIPEPLTVLLFGTGMVGLAGYMAARRK